MITNALILAQALLAANATGGNDPATETAGIVEKFTTWATDIGWVIAILCMILAGICFMFGPESMQKAKKWIIGILIGIALLMIAPSVIVAIRG